MQQYESRLSCFRLVPPLAALILLALFSVASAGEFSFHPVITVSEEYTDNVYETRDNKRYDFITRLLPGIALTYNSPLWDWDVNYAFDYRYYARNSRTDDNTHNLNVHSLTRVINDLFFLEVSDIYGRVSLDVSRDRTRESLFIDQSDSNTFIASPYFNFRPGPKTTVRTGYRYRNVWYKDPAGVDRQQHIGFAEATYEYSPRLNLIASYTYTHESSINPFDRHTPYLGFRYEYKDRSFVFAQGGYSWFRTKYLGDDNYPYWNAGITHVIGTYTVSLTTGVLYPDDPQSGVTRETDYALAVTKDFSRGNVGFTVSYANYSGNVSETENMFVGGVIDTENRYGVGMTARYDLGARLQATLTASVDKYDHRETNTYTRRIFVNPALTYPLPKDILLTLNYIYADYYSPLLYEDNYKVNRVILEARKTF